METPTVLESQNISSETVHNRRRYKQERDKWATNTEYKDKKKLQMKEYRDRINADDHLKEKKRQYMKLYRASKKSDAIINIVI